MGAIPGAIDASEVPQALNNLRTAIAAEQSQALDSKMISMMTTKMRLLEAPVNIGKWAFSIGGSYWKRY